MHAGPQRGGGVTHRFNQRVAHFPQSWEEGGGARWRARQRCLVNHLQRLHSNVSSCQSNVFTCTHLHCCSAKQMLNFSRDCSRTRTHFVLQFCVCLLLCLDSSFIFDSSVIKSGVWIINICIVFVLLLLPDVEHADQRCLQARAGLKGAAGAGRSELGLPRGDPQSQVSERAPHPVSHAALLFLIILNVKISDCHRFSHLMVINGPAAHLSQQQASRVHIATVLIRCCSGLCKVCIFIHCWLRAAPSCMQNVFSSETGVRSESPAAACRAHWSHSCRDVLTTTQRSYF